MKKINLLIPDPYSVSSYCVLFSMREFCNKVVVTVPAENWYSRIFSFSANSRYTDKIYYIPFRPMDWGRYACCAGNNETEERYISKVLDICSEEEITDIYPSHDSTVFLFSKNLHRFKEAGIFVQVLSWPILSAIIDKYEVMKKAESCGVNCPKTFLIENSDCLKEIIKKIDFPVILKPRFGSGSRGVYKIDKEEQLFEIYKNSETKYGQLIIQKFVPGSEMLSINVFMDKENNIVPNAILCWYYGGPPLKIFRNFDVSQRLGREPEGIEKILHFLKKIRLSGYANLQFKIDQFDNQPRLLEINARVGEYTWMLLSLGVNSPLLNYKISKNENILFPPLGRVKKSLFIMPVIDFFVFLACFWCSIMKSYYKLLGGKKKNIFAKAPSMRMIIKFYVKKYSAPSKEFDIFLKNFIKDPFVSLSYWSSFIWRLLKIEYPESFLDTSKE